MDVDNGADRGTCLPTFWIGKAYGFVPPPSLPLLVVNKSVLIQISLFFCVIWTCSD